MRQRTFMFNKYRNNGFHNSFLAEVDSFSWVQEAKVTGCWLTMHRETLSKELHVRYAKSLNLTEFLL